MKITYYGHSVVYFESNGKKVIIDPFISDNGQCNISVEDVEVDYIILTHGHNDHVGDTVELAKKHNAPVIAVNELANLMATLDCEVVNMGIGGQKSFEFGTVKFVHAFHSSSYEMEDGTVHYTGMPAGVIVSNDDAKFYHMGDTGLFGDIKLISDMYGPFDATFVPIGDNFTMGIDDAAYAVNEMLNTDLAIPIHYNTFPPIEVDTDQFVNKVDKKVNVLKSGDSIDI
ncbi:metal-dependent hydrolase [Aliicoccus persicus]|uniref:UPF0173 metal-dependent hydrolase K8V35_06270 n=1 Tax=Aliicoccus persicus TaxID=930138 RepID=A0A662Z1L6_9STAP|nr:metal-dependent hydrolase [Aliicoccus persicus]SEV87060.1 L-ascorbate metabolism protein UlaG, beta-lactamase superfamily [Aliicoccus persicus]HJE19939.1 metal-dependent hydrolase [Aliicoccus persicus]